MKEKQIGGKRPGAGRKRSDNPKMSVTLFVPIKSVEKFGGKEELRKAIYDFIEIGSIELPADYVQFEKIGVLGQDGVVKPLTFKNPSQKARNKAKMPDIEKPVEFIQSAPEVYDNPKIPSNLNELKAMCPKEIAGIDRSLWIAEERKKYGI